MPRSFKPNPTGPLLAAVSRSLLAAIVTTALLGAALGAAATADAASEIEGVWAFSGGEVAIATENGALEGVVVKATKFKECTHQVGEHMWTGMTLQPDGSYWGLHQWLYQGSCLPNTTLGPTAWRVLQNSEGLKYLKVCFSEPGKSQPTIAPNGVVAAATFGCVESTPTGSISTSTSITIGKAVTGCIAQRSLKLKLREPRHDPLTQVVVRLHGKKIADVRGVKRLRKAVVLKGLPSGGKYTIEVTATTVLNRKLTGRRTYRSCGKNSSGSLPLHGPKKSRRHR
jgi:hypothetical protein